MCLLINKLPPPIIHIIKKALTSFWFLPSLFLNSAVVGLMCHFFRCDMVRLAVLVLISFMLLFIGRPATYMFMFGCFITGYLYNVYLHKPLIIRMRKAQYLVVPVIIFFVCYYFFRYDTFVYTTGVRVWQDGQFSWSMLCIDFQRFVIGIVASLCFFALIGYYKLMPKKFISFITNCSKYSLGIYCFSMICYFLYVSAYDYFPFSMEFNHAYALLIALFFVIVAYYFFKFCDKFPLLRMLFLGSRTAS